MSTGNPVLCLSSAGHGGASGRCDALKEAAMDYAFLLNQWGITWKPSRAC
jgi:protease II